MSLLLAIVFPPAAFLLIRKPFQALLCGLLMVTLIGYLPAVIWAVAAVLDHRSLMRIEALARGIGSPGRVKGRGWTPLDTSAALLATLIPIVVFAWGLYWLNSHLGDLLGPTVNAPDASSLTPRASAAIPSPVQRNLPTSGPVARPASPRADAGKVATAATDPRKIAYGVLAAARLASIAEADLRYPYGTKAINAGDYADARSRALEVIRATKYAAIARRHEIDPSEVDSILVEGDRMGWPIGTVHVETPRPDEVIGVPVETPRPTKITGSPSDDFFDEASNLPMSDSRASPLLWMAKAHQKDGRDRQAAEAYREIVEKYPGTIEARAAAEALARLKRR